ncbi:MAG: hypothetical protein F6K42_35015 [Leptolyngbya sp. SIO1D8]|nr:hypothetical protein [Leptolyngbya sp. SIO1D8]
MNYQAGVLGGLYVAIGVAIAGLPAPTFARACRAAPLVLPSAETREFRNADLGLLLNIPNNYRSMLRSSGHITFHDPSSFEFIQCLVRTGEYGALPPYATLEIYKGVISGNNLVQIVRQKRPWVDYYSPEYTSIEVAGRPAVQYEYTHEIYQLSILNISLLSEDGQTLVTLSGPAQNPILQNALSTWIVEPSLQ